MGRLVMVGLSHHAAPVEVRERVAIDEAAWRACAPESPSTVLLSTCNRVEVYAWVDGRTRSATRALERSLAKAASLALSDLAPYVRRRLGGEAVLHLIRVASGLDSLIVGEEQIRGQVREAVRCAEACQELPVSLRGIFQRAIESARRVRGSTRLGQTPSIASAGVAVACRGLLSSISGELAVVLGAGVMARAAAEALLAHGARVRVLNRTPGHAERLMGSLRGAVSIDSLAALPAALEEAALIVGATASREAVVDRCSVKQAMLVRSEKPLTLLDIALPRDVEPAARDIPGVTLIDLDDLERLCPVDSSTRQSEHQRAEALAQQEGERVAEWLRYRAASPSIAELRSFAEAIRTSELRRSATRLRDLTPGQVAAVEALTNSIVNKLMHGPTVALRDAALSPAGLRRSHIHILRVVRPPRRRTARP